ncbi:MAG TPA: hypothetical protein VHV32_09785 [Candidatus Angelobacter sp.]|jgi:hypothetical protein|nr:hypothetical protein [Candidatus Angelobacter sp.]
MQAATLYFHYPCFDGLVSAALAWEFLESQKGWMVGELCPVNYTVRNSWLSSELKHPVAIVDFLYHPGADFWADHHATTMLSKEAADDYQRRRAEFPLYFDPQAGSCASLLFQHLGHALAGKPNFPEMVTWAEKIDSARYESVEEAILGDAPALKINRSIQFEPGAEYARFLCKELRNQPLNRVAALDEVKKRQDEVERRTRAGLKLVEKRIRMEPGAVAIFEAEPAKDEMINRYSAYYFAPDSRYSVGIIHSEDGTAITAMRNPWREFPSVELGKIFAAFGGGGHQRVGSIFIPKNESQRIPDVVKSLLSQLALTGPAVNV